MYGLTEANTIPVAADELTMLRDAIARKRVPRSRRSSSTQASATAAPTAPDAEGTSGGVDDRSTALRAVTSRRPLRDDSVILGVYACFRVRFGKSIRYIDVFLVFRHRATALADSLENRIYPEIAACATVEAAGFRGPFSPLVYPKDRR